MKGFRRPAGGQPINGRPEKLYQLLQSQSTVPYSGDGRTVSAIALKRPVGQTRQTDYRHNSVQFVPIGHRPSFRGHSTYQKRLPRRKWTDTPHRLWIDVLRGREVSGSTQGAGTAVTAGEVPQLKVVSGRQTRTRGNARSGLGTLWLTRRCCSTLLPRPSRSSTRQVSPYVLRRGGKAAPRGRACILVPSNFGRAIAIMIRDSPFRRRLPPDC